MPTQLLALVLTTSPTTWQRALEDVGAKGKDVSVFNKVGGSWQCFVDVWNSDAPAFNEAQ